MKCFSCFSDISEQYNFHWYPLPYCSKCNLVSIEINKIESFIEFSIKQYMRIKTIKDDLVYEHVKEMMFKKFDIRNKIYDSKSCHSTCSFLSTSDGLCKYNFINDKNLPLYFCILNDILMFDITKFENVIKQEIKKSYKKWFLWKRLMLALRRTS